MHYLYHQNYYELISTDLSGQKNMNIHQQVNFTKKIREDDGAAIFFIAEKQEKTISNFSLDSLILTE